MDVEARRHHGWMAPVRETLSQVDAPTRTAYRNARYEVHGSGGFVLHVDAQSPELHAAHQAHQVDCSAFLTACNPYGRLLDAASNAQRHSELLEVIRHSGLDFWPGFGADPERCWPGESSLLVFGLAQEPACRIARHFGQNALIWADADAIPRLLLLR